MRLDINQLTDFLADSLVQVNKKLILLFKEGTDVIRIILKEGALTIGTL